MAASHRQGQVWVQKYLDWAEGNDWVTQGKEFPQSVGLMCGDQPCSPEKIKEMLFSVETRLRQFQDTPWH